MVPIADAKKSANAQQDRWTTQVLTKRLWAKGVPAFSVLWLSEPDFAQHGSGPGSKVAKAALKSSDDNLARVLSALDEAAGRDKADLMLVSDHGFSTVAINIEVLDDLRKADLKASTSFATEPVAAEILVASLGAVVTFYGAGDDETVTRKLVRTLQKTAYAGVIFTRREAPGTFPLSVANLDTPDAPDVPLSLRWNPQTSASGLPGLVYSQGTKYLAGQGIHAGLGRYDMRNTLIAAGPDFKSAMVSRLPSGNVDIAPTVLWLLGIQPPKQMDGRVLGEALVDGPAPEAKPETTTLEARAKEGDRVWRQYLKLTRLGKHAYFDEGNGDVVLEK